MLLTRKWCRKGMKTKTKQNNLVPWVLDFGALGPGPWALGLGSWALALGLGALALALARPGPGCCCWLLLCVLCVLCVLCNVCAVCVACAV